MTEPRTKICAVITETSVQAAKQAIYRASREADLLELRLDYLQDFNFARVENLGELLADRPVPVILTCRDVREGGVQKVEDSLRLKLLVEGAKQFADFFDIELSHFDSAAKLSPDLTRMIVSHHDFAETPNSILEIYQRITKLPAAIHKIVTYAKTITDSIAIFRLLDLAEQENKTLIAIAMGEAGLLTRLLGPSFGSFLTFGSVSNSRQSAPGQISCADLRHLYRLSTLTRQTQITGIIGNPVRHSASPSMHNSAFSSLHIDSVYLPFVVEDVKDFFSRFVRPQTREIEWNLRGLSVTIPHKIEVMSVVDEVDDTAAAIGAVNTVVIENGHLLGFNTDVRSAMEPLQRATKLEGVHCAVLGAGGAARAVIYGLVLAGARVTVFARDVSKANHLANFFRVEAAPLDSLPDNTAEILIHTTPIGMQGHQQNRSLVPISTLKNRRIVYDLVYNPLETRLLRDARMAGCQTISGMEMLVAQAALQFELWTGIQAPVETMRDAALTWLTR